MMGVWRAPADVPAISQQHAAPTASALGEAWASGLVRRPLKPAKRDHGAHHTPDYDDQQVVSGPG